ncbi:hypothetical protein QBZ16_002032 [Prototheca wickerhamii]|uniref:Uncharacterized protein n=1 Tax=Prototheca wickerhamii TaxID=3111 RepID=A0AAD9MJB9_PROWI|nr:hypothetical protein QBZ16_002032 [Prototheca wickerhamii]
MDEMVSLGSCDTAQGSLEIAPDRLPWRRAGEDWHPETELDQSDAAGGEADPNDDPLVHDEGSVVRLQEIAAAIAEHERQQGSSVDDECAAALGALPASQQRQFAAGFREFADAMIAGFSELTRQHGADYVITAEDVERLNSAARQRLQDAIPDA